MTTKCINWGGATIWNGYGRRHHTLAHREAWEREHGPIPDGLHVLHHCDNRLCVNVSHMFLGFVVATLDQALALCPPILNATRQPDTRGVVTWMDGDKEYRMPVDARPHGEDGAH